MWKKHHESRSMSKRKTNGFPELIYMDLTSNHEVCFCFTRRVAIGYFFLVCSASMRLDWMNLEFMIKVNLENLLFHEERT